MRESIKTSFSSLIPLFFLVGVLIRNPSLGDWGWLNWVRNTILYAFVYPFVSAINYVWQYLLEAWNWINQVYAWARSELSSVYKWVRDELSYVYRWAKDELTYVYRWVRDEVTYVYRWAKDELSYVYRWAKDELSSTWKWITDRYERIREWWSKTKDILWDFATDTYRFLIRLLEDIVYAVADFIYDALVWFVDLIW